jgi:predicted SAM-dependent methyltransferase
MSELRDQARRYVGRAAVPVRRRYYGTGDGAAVVRRLPGRLRRILELDDPSAVHTRKIEIGPGNFALPGYLHVDVWPWSPHLEAVAPAWDLPFADGWAEEIRSVHSLEHVEPPRLAETLTEWRRVLQPGGKLHVSVPNGPAIMRSYLSAEGGEKWPLMGSLLGMYCNPAVREPTELTRRSDHQIVFDAQLLHAALEQAGFVDIVDRTTESDDRHSVGWRPMVDYYSLIMEARRPT